MKIWICHQYALAPHHAGVTRHFMLARELVRHGHDVTIIAAADSHKNPKACDLGVGEASRVELYDGVRFLWLRTPSAAEGKLRRVVNMLAFAWSVLSAPAVRRLPKPDLIIGNSPDPFTALAAQVKARRLRVPYVLHMGDIWPLSLIDIGGISQRHPFILLLKGVERLLYRGADMIVTPLPHAQAHVRAHGFKNKPFVHLPITVDPVQMRETVPADNKTFTFMFAGAHGAGNGVEGIVRAAAAFRDKYPARACAVRLVGAGGLKPALIALARDLKLDNLTFEDPVAKSDIFGVLAQADAFIVNIPDLRIFREGGISPNKVFDFLAAGRPVVIGCSAANNPVLDAGAGIAVAGDAPDKLAEAMAEMMDMDPQARKVMGDRGRDHVRRGHDVATVGGALEQSLASLTGKAGAPEHTAKKACA